MTYLRRYLPSTLTLELFKRTMSKTRSRRCPLFSSFSLFFSSTSFHFQKQIVRRNRFLSRESNNNCHNRSGSSRKVVNYRRNRENARASVLRKQRENSILSFFFLYYDDKRRKNCKENTKYIVLFRVITQILGSGGKRNPLFFRPSSGKSNGFFIPPQTNINK